MKNNLIKIYALAVCFVSIACLAITTGIAIYTSVVYVWPPLGIPTHLHSAYQTNDAYRQSPYLFRGNFGGGQRSQALYSMSGNPYDMSMMKNPASKQDKDAEVALTEEEVTEVRLQQYELLLDNTKIDALKSLLRYLIIISIAAPLFYIHWRLAKREQ
jgi:hypothetical protein